jgi:3-oxoacyl-[acyl-carrier protein] reductase
LAVNWGALKIRVNLLNPGIVDVPGRLRGNSDIFTSAVRAVIPLGRTALAEEVASVCIFLSSFDARYITGTSINLDGGEHLKDHFSLAYKILENKQP